jgi:hypothetical protein
MGLAGAAFHWTPQTYWASTRHEFFAAYEAWRKMNKPAGRRGENEGAGRMAMNRDVAQLLLQVDASVALAQRNLNQLAQSGRRPVEPHGRVARPRRQGVQRVGGSAASSAAGVHRGAGEAADALIGSIDPLYAAQVRYDKELGEGADAAAPGHADDGRIRQGPDRPQGAARRPGHGLRRARQGRRQRAHRADGNDARRARLGRPVRRRRVDHADLRDAHRHDRRRPRLDGGDGLGKFGKIMRGRGDRDHRRNRDPRRR